MASAVPSPPSATGRRSISRGLAAGQPSRQPSAKASAAWAAERVPLNLSGAISTCIEREERSFSRVTVWSAPGTGPTTPAWLPGTDPDHCRPPRNDLHQHANLIVYVGEVIGHGAVAVA